MDHITVLTRAVTTSEAGLMAARRMPFSVEDPQLVLYVTDRMDGYVRDLSLSAAAVRATTSPHGPAVALDVEGVCMEMRGKMCDTLSKWT